MIVSSQLCVRNDYCLLISYMATVFFIYYAICSVLSNQWCICVLQILCFKAFCLSFLSATRLNWFNYNCPYKIIRLVVAILPVVVIICLFPPPLNLLVIEVTEDMCVNHFLIQPDPEGVKLQGWAESSFSKNISLQQLQSGYSIGLTVLMCFLVTVQFQHHVCCVHTCVHALINPRVYVCTANQCMLLRMYSLYVFFNDRIST